MGRAPEAGCQIGPLQFERELGRGAFAAVWLARNTVLDRPVAVKVLRTFGGAAPEGDADAAARFLHEARVVGRLKSPHVVTLYGVHPLAESGGWEEGYLLEMEYVEEGTLQDALDRGERLPPQRTVAIAKAIAAALAAAHSHGVVHGDVKPGNVLLGRHGEVKLSDFGLATLAGDPSRAWNLRREVAGTPSYMAPEVVQGERATAASDIWGVGVILYQLLAGRLPFDGRTADGLFAQIHNAEPPALAPDVPQDLANLTTLCLAKQATSRPQSAGQLLAALDEAVTAAPSRSRGTEGPAEPSVAPGGREAESARIAAVLDRALGGAGCAVCVSGDAGMGKSALLRHVADLARRRGFHVVEATVTPLRGVVRPLLFVLRDLVVEPAEATSGGTRKGPLVTTTDLGRHATAVRRALGVGEEVRPPDQHEAAWAAEQILAAVARRRPVAVLVDDAHLSDRQDASLLADVAAHLRESPFVLVVAGRPREDDRPGGEPGAVSAVREALTRAGAENVELGPLPPDMLFSVLRSTARGLRIAPEVAGRILDVAEGNPLLGVELLRHLLQTGAVAERDGSLVAGPSFASADLPRRFHELVALRLERLPDEDRALLDVAAVDGTAFDGEALAAVLEQPLLGLLRRLQVLARRGGLIVPQAAGYRFAHAVVHEAVYRELAPDLRREMHRRLAEHLEARGASTDAERLGIHWERAGRPERAAPYLLRAALEATRRQEYLRAIDLATRGGLLAEGFPLSYAAAHADLLFALCGCYSDLGRHEAAEDIVTRVLAAADASGDDVLRERAAVWREDVRFHARGGESVDVEALERACEALPRSEELGRAQYLLGSVAKLRDRLDEATRRLHAAQSVFADLGQRQWIATTTNQLASVALRAGRLAEAEAAYAEAAASSTVAGRRTNAAVSAVNGVLAAISRGKVEGLDVPLLRAIRTLETAGATNLAAQASLVLAQVRQAAGDSVGAERAIADALEPLERTGFLPGIASARIERARIAANRGDLDAAQEDLVAAREAARSSGDRDVTLKALALDVRCASYAADRRTALASAHAAVAVARAGAGAAAAARLVFSLAESVFHGLPAAALDDADDLAASIAPGEHPVAALAAPFVAAAREYRSGNVAHDALRRACAALRERPCGERRAERLALAAWIDVEATWRRGDAAGAAAAGEVALRAAKDVGHVWIEAAVLAVLVRAVPGKGAEERLTALLDRIDRGLKWDGDRRRLSQAWGRD